MGRGVESRKLLMLVKIYLKRQKTPRVGPARNNIFFFAKMRDQSTQARGDRAIGKNSKTLLQLGQETWRPKNIGGFWGFSCN